PAGAGTGWAPSWWRRWQAGSRSSPCLPVTGARSPANGIIASLQSRKGASMQNKFAVRLAIAASLGCLLSTHAALAHESHGKSGAPAAQLGRVSFANSGKAAAQTDFLRGLALLHNFEY